MNLILKYVFFNYIFKLGVCLSICFYAHILELIFANWTNLGITDGFQFWKDSNRSRIFLFYTY